MVSTTVIKYVNSAPYTWYIANEANPTGWNFANNANNQSVRALGRAMEQGRAETLRAIGNDGIIDLRGSSADEVYDSMFSTAKNLRYVDNIIFTATADETLGTEIVEAGEELLAALAYFRKLSEALSITNASPLDRKQLPATNDPKDMIAQSIDDSPDFSISFTNQLNGSNGSPGETLNLSAAYLPTKFVIREITAPAQTMPPFDTEVMSWEIFGKGVEIGRLSAYVTWKSSVNPKFSFGVMITIPHQVAHVGYPPYYQVSYTTPDKTVDWFQPGPPAAPYTFPDETGYKIVCTPTAGGTTMFVDVEIQNIPAS